MCTNMEHVGLSANYTTMHILPIRMTFVSLKRSINSHIHIYKQARHRSNFLPAIHAIHLAVHIQVGSTKYIL
jgi:hypothetical protein